MQLQNHLHKERHACKDLVKLFIALQLACLEDDHISHVQEIVLQDHQHEVVALQVLHRAPGNMQRDPETTPINLHILQDFVVFLNFWGSRGFLLCKASALDATMSVQDCSMTCEQTILHTKVTLC